MFFFCGHLVSLEALIVVVGGYLGFDLGFGFAIRLSLYARGRLVGNLSSFRRDFILHGITLHPLVLLRYVMPDTCR